MKHLYQVSYCLLRVQGYCRRRPLVPGSSRSSRGVGVGNRSDGGVAENLLEDGLEAFASVAPELQKTNADALNAVALGEGLPNHLGLDHDRLVLACHIDRDDDVLRPIPATSTSGFFSNTFTLCRSESCCFLSYRTLEGRAGDSMVSPGFYYGCLDSSVATTRSTRGPKGMRQRMGNVS